MLSKPEIAIKPKPISRSVRLENLTKREGWRGIIYSPSGSKYTGIWRDNSKYTGNWHENKRHGTGEYISANNWLFSGYFENNRPVRYGVSAYGRGGGNNTFDIQYRGEWQDGRFHGDGILHYRDESIYKGKFIKSKREGYGKMWYQNGAYYEGDWLNDQRHGDGIFVDCKGNRYEGQFVRDKKHGRGIMFLLPVGQYMDGVWDRDLCVTSIMADIPYRQTGELPTPYDLREVQLDDEANLVVDNIEMAVLNLCDAPESILEPSVSATPAFATFSESPVGSKVGFGVRMDLRSQISVLSAKN